MSQTLPLSRSLSIALTGGESAAEKYPNGLPEPYSDDPTQWLFHGHPRHAEPGTELHVALARVAGYGWPAETDAEMRLSAEARARIAETATFPAADADGLLALVPVLGERSLADRLRSYCVAAWGHAWTPATEVKLIASACERAKDKPPKQPTFDAWLRTHAARQQPSCSMTGRSFGGSPMAAPTASPPSLTTTA